MKITDLLAAGALTSLIVSPVSAADVFSAAQKDNIEKIVHSYLVQNPEVLVEASRVLQAKQEHEMQQQAKAAIEKNANLLFDEKLAVAGNPKGDVTLVEFFDYQCGHCKEMKPTIDALIKKHPNLRVVYKEFPIFGKNSEVAARAALAAAMQGKYHEMQAALFKMDHRLDKNIVMDVAKKTSVDVAKLSEAMEAKAVTEALEANRKLAEKMHLMGTPAIIIAGTANGQLKPNTQPSFIPGAASEESLNDLIQKAGGKV